MSTINNGLSLADQVANELREDIIGGRLAPGAALVESELVNTYNASRNTVREAVHQLEREGLTRYVRNKGVIVRRLGLDDVRDIFQVRRTLELQAILLSKPLREYQSDLMLEAIEAAEQARGHENWQAFGTHSLRFHQHIVGLMRSPRFDQFFTNITAQMRLLFSAAPSEEGFQRPWLERDRYIHDLLADGHKQQAADALGEYLNDSEQGLLNLFGSYPHH